MTYEYIIEILQVQIVPIIIAFVAYGLAHIANILLGAGCAYENNNFDKKKFFNGFKRGLFVLLGCVLAIFVVNMLTFLVVIGINIEGLETTINYITVVMTLGIATVIKLGDVLQKLLAFTGVVIGVDGE